MLTMETKSRYESLVGASHGRRVGDGDGVGSPSHGQEDDDGDPGRPSVVGGTPVKAAAKGGRRPNGVGPALAVVFDDDDDSAEASEP